MRKRMILAVLPLLMFMAGNLWAQGLPGTPGTGAGIFASPQSDASQGRYRSDADNFMRVDSWAGVKFDKWFGFTSFAPANGMATGFATKAGDIYIGALYTGNFWANKPSNNYDERTLDFFGTDKKDYPVYGTVPAVATGPFNNIAVMIGVADMGIRLMYRTNHQSFRKNDIMTGGIPTMVPDPADPDPANPTLPLVPGTTTGFYKNYETGTGYLAPHIAWGMAKDLVKDIGIRPYVMLDFDIHQNYRKSEYYTSASATSGMVIGNSQNRFEPKLTAGLGGVHFINKNGFRGTVDIDYDLTFKFYNNEYNYTDAGGIARVNNLSGLNTNGVLTDDFYIRNQIIPSIAGSWSKEKLALRFKLNLPVNIIGEEATAMALKNPAESALEKHGDYNKSTEISFRPDLRLALQWRIIPNKLSLNASGRIEATPLSAKTTKVKEYENGVEKTVVAGDTTKKIENDFRGTFTNMFRVGATFNFTENVWIEASTGVWGANGQNSMRVFSDTNGLFSFGNILVGLKF